MKVENINIDILKPFEKNPKSHPAEQIDRIVRSIREFGWANPILALKENNMVIAGHARLKAARKMNLSEVPVIFLDMPYEKAIAYVVADNRLAELAEWDNSMLLPLLDEIKLSGIDVELTGFTTADISLMNKHEVQEDDFDAQAAADAIKEPITKLGDIWILGKHRLICADATNKEEMVRLMDGHKADLLITDPPYGVSYADKNKFLNAIDKGNRVQTPIKNDHKTVPEMNELWVKAFTLMNEHCKSGASYYVCSPQGGELLMMMSSLQKAGWLLKHSIIWVKNNHVLGRSDYHYKHEPILYGWKEGAAHSFYGGSGKFSTWFFDKPHKSDLHPTMKPLALMAEAINNSSKGEDIIIDWFAGSGSTLMACEQTGRIAYCAELDEKYCDVICQRFLALTGITAHLQEVSP